MKKIFSKQVISKASKVAGLFDKLRNLYDDARIGWELGKRQQSPSWEKKLKDMVDPESENYKPAVRNWLYNTRDEYQHYKNKRHTLNNMLKNHKNIKITPKVDNAPDEIVDSIARAIENNDQQSLNKYIRDGYLSVTQTAPINRSQTTQNATTTQQNPLPKSPTSGNTSVGGKPATTK